MQALNYGKSGIQAWSTPAVGSDDEFFAFTQRVLGLLKTGAVQVDGINLTATKVEDAKNADVFPKHGRLSEWFVTTCYSTTIILCGNGNYVGTYHKNVVLGRALAEGRRPTVALQLGAILKLFRNQVLTISETPDAFLVS